MIENTKTSFSNILWLFLSVPNEPSVAQNAQLMHTRRVSFDLTRGCDQAERKKTNGTFNNAQYICADTQVDKQINQIRIIIL